MWENCTPQCAVPVPCPVCGNDLPPVGRAVPLEWNIPTCCDDRQHTSINTRHLWSVNELENNEDRPLVVDDDAPTGLSLVIDTDGNEVDPLFNGARMLQVETCDGGLLIRNMPACWIGEGQVDTVIIPPAAVGWFLESLALIHKSGNRSSPVADGS